MAKSTQKHVPITSDVFPLDVPNFLQRRSWYCFNKRCLDILLSSLGIFCLVPLLLIVALAIKWDDPNGTVLFSQERIGRNGRPFRIFKFRTMCMDAESQLPGLLHMNEVQGHMFKIKNDPRITDIGKFLRKTSIDELPQLFNVLRGEMSLVGPRPPLPREVAEYNAYHRLRLLVKPGCTGLWQVQARNLVGFREMVIMDLEYIRTQSIRGDLVLIIKTVKVMLRPWGAY